MNKHDEEVLDTELLAYRINEILYDRHLTPTDIWKEYGVDRTMMSLYTRGRRVPSLYNLIRIARALDVSLDYLVGNEGDVKVLASEIKNLAVFQKGASAREIEEKAEQIIRKYSGSRL